MRWILISSFNSLDFTFQVFDSQRKRFISRQAVQVMIQLNHGEHQLDQRLYRLVNSLHKKYGVSYKTENYSLPQFHAMVRLAPDLIHCVTQLQVRVGLDTHSLNLHILFTRIFSKRRPLGEPSGTPRLVGKSPFSMFEV